MEIELSKLINKIEQSITSDEFVDISYDIVEEIENRLNYYK